ncbi:MAG: hypothetical protein K1X57_13275 [Gemmataceae bacterium]|nr:hypothetical protein [Gemmataceae bacterium]
MRKTFRNLFLRGQSAARPARVRRNDRLRPQLAVLEERTTPATTLVSAPDVIGFGGTTYTVSVKYDAVSPQNIKASTIGVTDVVIANPFGAPLVAKSFVATPATNAPSITVDYLFDAPGGAWSQAKSGRYTVQFVNGEVEDDLGNQEPGADLGKFLVVGASTITVDTLDGSADDDFSTGKLSLLDAVAISIAKTGADTIGFSVTGTITPASAIVLSGDLTIKNNAGPAALTVSGADAITLFDADVGVTNLVLDGLTVSKAKAVGFGGSALTATGTVVTINNCVFDSNYGESNGGSVQFDSCTVTVTNTKFTNNLNAPTGNNAGNIGLFGTNVSTFTGCEFTGNKSDAQGTALGFGGVFANYGSSSATFNDCDFLNNEAVDGYGGVMSGVGNTGTTEFNDCLFQGNKAVLGGVFQPQSDGNLTVRRSQFINNSTSSSYGGVYGQFTTRPATCVTLFEDCSFISNTALNSGGVFGISGPAAPNVNAQTIIIRNSTASGNSAAANGGFIRTFASAQITATITIQNSTIAGNTGGSAGGISVGNAATQVTFESTAFSKNITGTLPLDIAGTFVAATNSFVSAKTTAVVTTSTATVYGTQAAPLDAKLASTPANFGGGFLTLLPLAGSPLIGAGSNPAGLANDQRGTGFPRAFGGTVDIGAIEANAAGLPFVAGTSLPATVTTGGPGSVTFTVTYADDTAIKVSSIDVNDLTVTGPAAAKITAAVVDVPSDGTPRTVTYTMQMNDGSFDLADRGTYTVTLNSNQVLDSGSAPVPTAVLGNVYVAIGETIVVNATNDEATDSDGKTSLREAILKANSNLGYDTITFDGTVFATPQTIGLSTGTEIVITDSVNFASAPARVTVDGLFSTRALRVSTAPVYAAMKFSVNNMGFTQCLGNGDGGAILIQVAGTATVDNCVFTSNSSAVGDFSGGAIAVPANTLTITNSVFTGNSADLSGGAIFTGAGIVTLRGNTIANNTARRGGGFLSQGAVTFVMENCTVSGNNATELATSGRAGGLGFFGFADSGGSVVIRNSTITNNTAAGLSGGGIHATNTSTNPITFESTILAGNVHLPNADPGTVVSPDYYGPNSTDTGGLWNTTLTKSIIGSIDNTPNYFKSSTGSLVGTLVTPVDAKLDVLAANGATNGQLTHALLTGSPAIDAGSNPSALSFDQRGTGFARVLGPSADMGAFESPGAVATPAKVTSVSVNGGGIQRSRVTSVVVTFDNAPTFAGSPAAAFTLERFVAGVGTGNTVTLGASVLGNVVTLTFSGALTEAVTNSLVDGVYQLRIDDAQLTNLDGDANGSIGGDYATATTSAGGGIFRLFGDADGSALVDTADFLAFRLSFLSSNPTFDADGNGSVDTGDFLRFRLNFLKSV